MSDAGASDKSANRGRPNVRVGATLEVSIDALARSGAGVGFVSIEGVEARFEVAGALAGERVSARVEAVSRHRAELFGSVASVVEPSAARRRAPCHHAAPTRGECGGCPLMHLSDDAQREAKQEWVRASLAPLGFGDIAVESAPAALGYRNRSNYLAFAGANGAVRLGSRAARTGEPARMDGCLAVHPAIERVAAAVAAESAALRVPVHPAPGGLRYVSARVGDDARVLVELIFSGEPLDERPTELAARLGALGDVAGVIWTSNPDTGNAIHSAQSERRGAIGADSVGLTLGGVRVELGPDAFAQLNTAVADRMAHRAAVLAATAATAATAAKSACAEPPSGAPAGPVVWDLYCGVGTLGLAAARELGGAVRLWGVEVSASATGAAARAAADADVDAEFVTGDLSSFAPPESARHGAPTVVVANPPRRGLDAPVRAWLAADRAPLVMMSCSPESFARDVAALVAAGRRVAHVEAHDMLPQTTHVELLALIE
ncbi:MAG: class I SAM-dependent RNA methyltransferase [Myxococcales bacterium]|nr:class I SAM-dependent RNA methyltransferase [Myxococcales bacterium]